MVHYLLIRYLTIELALGFNSQHPQRWRHVQVLWDPHVAKVHEKVNAPDRQPVCKNKRYLHIAHFKSQMAPEIYRDYPRPSSL
jgi:hypothetical protein